MLKLNLNVEESNVITTTVYFDGYRVIMPETEAQALLESLAEKYKVSQFDVEKSLDKVKTIDERINKAVEQARRYRIHFKTDIICGNVAYTVPKDVKQSIPTDAFSLFCKALEDKHHVVFNRSKPYYGAFIAEKDENDLKILDSIEFIDDVF